MPDERPREALLSFGPEYLPLSKLFAIVLRTGRRGISAEDLARKLLGTFASLRGIDSATVSEIRTISGIGPAKAAQIKAALEIGKRLCREEADGLPDRSGPGWALRYVMKYYGPYLRDAPVESICLILLNGRRAPIRAVELGRGDSSQVMVDPTLVVREAVRSGASYVILVHNHPSGKGEPSRDDAALTIAVRDACALFAVHLLDHIIIGRSRENCRSLAMAGLLQIGQPRQRLARTPPGGIVNRASGSRDRLLPCRSELKPQGRPAERRPKRVSGGNHRPRRKETDPAPPDRSSE
jgi:DNA repair protein RadC